MRFEGSTEFMAERPAIYSILIEPSRIGPCAPVPIERVDDRHFKATTKVGGGLFSARCRSSSRWSRRSRTSARGSKAGVAAPEPRSRAARRSCCADGSMAGMTAVDWVAEVELEGMLAGPASRIIADQGEQAIAKLLECLRSQVEG